MSSSATFKKWRNTISAEQEYSELIEGNVTGNIPEWINGNFLRNGPAKFEVGDTKYNHLFDGLAMIQKYNIKDGKVYFQAKFLKSETYNKNMAANRIVVSEFGTMAFPDPCKSLFQRYMSLYFPHEATDNASVNIVPFNDELYAATETPFITRIDAHTLDTIEKHDLSKFVSVNMATAHPHVDADGCLHNLGSCYKESGGPAYALLKIPPHDAGQPAPHKAFIAAKIKARWRWNPSYSHSFGMSKNYYIMVESPLVINVPRVMVNIMTHRSITDAITWLPKETTLIHVVDKESGEEVACFSAESFFTFHHVNAYEEDENLIVDVVAYRDGGIINKVTMENMTEDVFNDNIPELRRYVLPLVKNFVTLKGSSAKVQYKKQKEAAPQLFCTPEVMCDTGLEFPTINYRQFNTKKYRYIYGMSSGNIHYKVVKVDLETKTCITWGEEFCSVTEPIFVAKPDAKDEDDGVVLCSVHHIVDDKRHQFLVVLDAKTLKEIGRADFPTVSIPANFHGNFFPET